MPAQSVQRYTCERCGKVWYEDEEVPVAKLMVRMQLSDGSTIGDEYGVLCKGCEKTAQNYAAGLVKKMTKQSPDNRKGGAKEKGDGSPSSISGLAAPGTSVVAQPTVAAPRPHHSDGSSRQSRSQ